MRSDGTVEEIKSRLDIVEVVSDYIELKRSGTNYKGLCPFHAEKTPSFMVNPERQIFHCFGCSAGGDMFTFVMKHEGLEFKEALALLAKRAGVELTPPTRKDREASKGREAVREMQNEALLYFTESLKRSSHARDYILKRGISPESIERFRLGYAPSGWHNLYDRLKKKGYKDDDILRSGLVSRGQRGPYDVFRDRVIFPIFDRNGEPIAFGGRVMGEGEPKYLNSSDSLVFTKSETLYALDRARNDIRQKDYSMICEGYLDAIMCHQYGLENTVAPLGTALTQGHLKLLGRVSKNVLLLFDGDQAGINAARRSLTLIVEANMRSKVLTLPEGEDPDSILNAQGAEGMKTHINRAQTPMAFMLATGGPDRVTAIKEAVSLVAKAADPITRDEMLRELAGLSDSREQTLREELNRLVHLGRRYPGQEPARPRRTRAVLYDAETLLLSAALQSPAGAKEIASRLDTTDFENRNALELIRKIADQEESERSELLELAETDEQRALLTRLSVEPGIDPENITEVIEDCIRKLNARRIEDQIRSAKSSGDMELLSRLYSEKQKLLQGAK